MTDAADGGIADRGGGRGSYRVIDFNTGQFCSGHIVRRASLAPGFRSANDQQKTAPVYLNRFPSRARARRAAATTAIDLREPAGVEKRDALAGAGVFVLAKLLVADSWVTMELGQ